LTAAQSRVLGFEAPTQDWRTSNSVALGSSSIVSQGAAALSVVPNGYIELFSSTMRAPGGALSTATVDVRLSKTQTSGDVHLVMQSPSAGLSWSDFGVVSLVGRPANSYQTLSFTVPAAAKTVLNGNANDINFRLVFNVGGNSGTFLVDNLVVASTAPTVLPTTNTEFKVLTPRSSGIADMLISSTSRVTIDDRSTLAKVAKPSRVANLGTNTLEFGAGVKAYADVTSIGSLNFLRSGSSISGSLTTSGTINQQNNVTIGGPVKTNANVQSTETKWSVSWPNSGVNNVVSRPPDSPNFEVVPGEYDSIQAFSRSTITFRSGTYFINSLILEPQAHFRVDTSAGPVLIYVKNTLTLRVGLEYVAGPRGQVLFGYLGTQPALFEEALVASVVAPLSAIELRRPASLLPHEGSFFGKEVHVFSDATVLHLPLDWTFLCPQGDHDGDGINACNETCDNDPLKTEPKACGCGEPETDTDGDLVPDCIDECDNDPVNQHRGQCGCANEPGVAPAGKACTDGIANGTFTCNGAGTCGTPASAAPQSGCTVKTLGTHAYWFCPAATPAQAAQRCNSSPGGRLVQIDTYLENYFVSRFVNTSALTGATDRTTEGEWTWRYTATLDAKKFWTGGATGRPYHGLFARFPGGEPRNDDALDCGLIDSKGNWSIANCGTSVPYVCERPFGPSYNPGDGPTPHTPLGPDDAYVGWIDHNGGGDGSTIPLNICSAYTPGTSANHPEYGGVALQSDTVELYNCDRDCEGKTEAECRALGLCAGAANPPPVGATGRCSNTGNPSQKVGPIMSGPGCSLVNHDCSATSALHGMSLVCGEHTRCFEVRKRATGQWLAQQCADTCGPTATCDAASGLCVENTKGNVCDTLDGALCVGQCFNQLGCGVPLAIDDGGYTEADLPCEETRYCVDHANEYAGPMNGTALSQNEPINLAQLPDESTAPPPAYSNDFQTGCGGGSCNGCAAESAPSCARSARHPWCTMDAALPPQSSGTSAVRDTRAGGRGDTSVPANSPPNTAPNSPIQFDLDPGADLDFHIAPLPFGLARFDLNAAAAIRATAKFAIGPIRGDIEIVDLRGQLIASMCRVSTAESKMEILGKDFLPGLAGDLRFDTAVTQPLLTKSCEDAVNTYVDVVDRAKKAMRDAQELIKQYEDQKKTGHTFNNVNKAFCKAVADAGVRPKGMPGAGLADPCANESVEDTVNAFITYYQTQVGLIDGARQALADAVLNSSTLANTIGLGSRAAASSGFDFYASFGDFVKGEETTTLLSVNFFIGPVPCNLEVSSYMHYGIQGGLGLNLRPQTLIDGAGDFAKAGAIVMPYADSGVTLFVGVGFDAGPLSVKLGLAGSITLANVQLPATAAAGLAINPERISATDRPLPMDLADLGDGRILYPPQGLSRYNFQYAYSYGVDLTLSDILSGHIDGTLIVKFFWFKKRWSKQLLSFTGLPKIGPFHLISGGSPAPSQWPNEPVAEDTRSWTSGYDSVPFVMIAPVKPATTPVTADASFNTTRVSQLFYDSLCTCDLHGTECSRKADCCDAGDRCLADPSLGTGKTICSVCQAYAPPTYENLNGINQGCVKDDDCCPGSTCQAGITVRENCVLSCNIPSYLAAHVLQCNCPNPAYYDAHETECKKYYGDLGFEIHDPIIDSTCNTHIPTWKVCAAPPTGPGDPPQ